MRLKMKVEECANCGAPITVLHPLISYGLCEACYQTRDADPRRMQKKKKKKRARIFGTPGEKKDGHTG